MSIVPQYTNITYESKACIKNGFEIVGNKAYYLLNSNVQTHGALAFDGKDLKIKASNMYKIDLAVYPTGCPMMVLPINMEIVEPVHKYLSVNEQVTEGNNIHVLGVFPKGTILRFYTDKYALKYFSRYLLAGIIGKSDLPEIFRTIDDIDAATKVRYINQTPPALSVVPPTPFPPAPPAPGSNKYLPAQYPQITTPTETVGAIFPWNVNVIPTVINKSDFVTPPLPLPSPLPPTIINGYGDKYDKFGSLPEIIRFYTGNNGPTLAPDDQSLTLFLKNLDVRGHSIDESGEKWKSVNDLKKIYMGALSLDKLQFYLETIDTFANTSFADVTVSGKPFISSFSKNLIEFFLRMHLGSHQFPQYVIDFFVKFATLISVSNEVTTELLEITLYGNLKHNQVRDYFREKTHEAIKIEDQASLVYWWSIDGMSIDSLVSEALHNIIAFNQFTNTMYQIIYTSLHPQNNVQLPPGSPPLPNYPNFFKEYLNAKNQPSVINGTIKESDAKLNVIREIFRLLVPNSASFSRVYPSQPDSNRIRSMHLHQQIMISNNQPMGPLPGVYRYFTYNPDQYNNTFKSNLDGLRDLEVVESENLRKMFVQSPIDKETVIDVTPTPEGVRPIVPIYDRPTYAPFGLGYRRCAGETFTYLVLSKLLDKFATVEYEERPGTYPSYPVAPFSQVTDNVFVKKI